jgi:hypothetical protein
MRTSPSPLKACLTVTLLWTTVAAPARAASPVATVHCDSSVSTLSWEPLPRTTILRVVQGRVLQVLTRSGRLALLPAKGSDPADLKLKIVARIIEDAAQFSVFVSATPRRLSNVGSLAAVATHSIAKQSHKGIQRQMERTADEAGEKLAKLLEPRLHLIRGGGDQLVPYGTARQQQLNWGRGLAARAGGRLAARLLAKGGGKTLDEVRLQAEKEANARLALGRCALGARDAELQTRCIDALAQLARRHPFAQRAIIAVLMQAPPKKPRDKHQHYGTAWKAARRKAFTISTTFEGVAHEEAVQAWLQIFGADNADYYLMGYTREDTELLRPIADYLKRRKAVPNLDLALTRCTRMSRDGKPPNSYCLSVVQKLPPNRRVALLYDVMKGFDLDHDTRGEYRAWSGMLRTVSSDPLHPMIEKICRERIQRSFNYYDRTTCLDALGRYGEPTPDLLGFVVQTFVTAKTPDSIAGVPKVAFRSVSAMESLVRRRPELCVHLIKILKPHIDSGSYPKLYKRQDYVPRGYQRCLEQVSGKRSR